MGMPPSCSVSSAVRVRHPLLIVTSSQILFPEVYSTAPTLRYILLNMIEEYARHNGHADLIREAIDGLVGHDPPLRPHHEPVR
jgi:hypothetical protein